MGLVAIDKGAHRGSWTLPRQEPRCPTDNQQAKVWVNRKRQAVKLKAWRSRQRDADLKAGHIHRTESALKPAFSRALRVNQRRWISPEPLNVTPALVGLPLADPRRRATAMLVDLVVVALLSGVSGFWLLGGLLLVVLQLRSQRGSTTRKRQVVGWLGAGLMFLLVLQAAKSDWDERAPGTAAWVSDAGSAPASNAPEAVERGQTADIPSPTAVASAAHARILQLQAELEQARQPLTLRQWFDRLLDDLGAKFGWGVVYFSLLPAWWSGQTVGKKLLGLQVVELTGQPMTVMRCLKRYGGYAAGLATGGLGFAQALWDPNRQAIQDKAAHTAVVDLRVGRAGSGAGHPTELESTTPGPD